MPKHFSKFDIAIILVMLPSVFQLKLPLFIYLVIAFILLRLNIQFNRFVLFAFAFAGMITVWFSYILQFQGKFMGLDVILTFLGMIFLVLTISFRLNRRINTYLILSTFLVLVFSLHYYEAIYIMSYSIFCLYSFLILYLWDKQAGKLKDAVSYANKMMLYSFPLILLLFLLFPRIDFKSFHNSKIKNQRTASGFDGKISLRNAGPLTPSSKKAFEVWFESDVPDEKHLYFRGSVLYADEFGRFNPRLDKDTKGEPTNIKEINPYRYTINIFPNGKKWLYSLDYLSKASTEIDRYKDGTILTKEKITDNYRYNLISELVSYENILSKEKQQNSLMINSYMAPQLYNETRYIRKIKKPQERLNALIQYLNKKQLSYKLDVKRLKSITPVDEFLFETKEGYCVHFSVLFTTAAQFVNLPSRIVTGYLTSPKEMYEDYIFVSQKNAHAWSEVYIENKGWIRFEATSLATGNIDLYPKKEGLSSSLEDFALYLKYMIHTIEEGLIDLAFFLDLDFLEDSLEETGVLLQTFIGFSFLAVLLYLLVNVFALKQKEEQKELQKLLKLFKKHGYIKLQGETIEAFLKRVSLEKDKDIKESLFLINDFYHNWVYGEKLEDKKAFKTQMKILKKKWK